MLSGNKRLIGILAGVTLLLFIPLIAMQFSTGVDWDGVDFAIAAVLLFGTGLLCEFVMRRVKKKESRLALIGGILVILFLIWAELAVGIFGSPIAGS